MTPHNRMDHWRALFDAHPTRRVNRVNYEATQRVIEQRYDALEARRATPEYQRKLRVRRVDREKRKAELKRKKELLEASTSERKLYALMQRDAQVQKERMFRDHVRDTESPDDGDHRFAVWHHAGRPEVWLDGRATCTVAEFIEEYGHLCGVDDDEG
jgi:hypothetical protein